MLPFQAAHVGRGPELSPTCLRMAVASKVMTAMSTRMRGRTDTPRVGALQ